MKKRYICFLLCFFSAIVLFFIPIDIKLPQNNTYKQGDVTILYNCKETNDLSSSVEFEVQVKNNTSTAINLSDVTIHYYFTKDNGQSFLFQPFYNESNEAIMLGRFYDVTPNEVGADHCLEIRFTQRAGELAPKATSEKFIIKFTERNSEKFVQTNDFSFNPTSEKFHKNMNMVSYIKGQLEFGNNPITNSVPRAKEDRVMTEENIAVIVDVLRNDSGLESELDPTSVKILDRPKNGKISIEKLTGVVTYTPNVFFYGTDRFNYTVKDNRGIESKPVTVKIIVKKHLLPADDLYIKRFLELWNDLHSVENGYFSEEGIPYYAPETLIVGDVEYGHLSTSEVFSYYIWLEAMYGQYSGDWSMLKEAWDVTEKYMIPSKEQQVNWNYYDTSQPVEHIEEYIEKKEYLSSSNENISVGEDPITDELTEVYGEQIYDMHWLLDVENWYGFGGKYSDPIYVNTFERGFETTTWETIPHPSVDLFYYGGPNGFVDLYKNNESYSKQWQYKNDSNASARVVQAMYWANKWAKEQNITIEELVKKAVKMGDFLRGNFFERNFNEIKGKGKNNNKGYNNATYLLSSHYTWGGALDKNLAWKIGSNTNESANQNPMTAWVLSTDSNFKPLTSRGIEDWATSSNQQLAFLTWLQSSTGAIAYGAVVGNQNDIADPATFYGLTYQGDLSYLQYSKFVEQTKLMQCIAELYYETKNKAAEELLNRWIAWVKTEIELNEDGTFSIPAILKWEGKPDVWEGARSDNASLKCTVLSKDQDLNNVALLAQILTYYAGAAGDEEARRIAQELLDRMWTLYRDDKGLSTPEIFVDYYNFFEKEVYMPNDWLGLMPNGDVIQHGNKYINIRSQYTNDPNWNKIVTSYENGEPPEFTFHRFQTQVNCALAYGLYGEFFGEEIKDWPPIAKDDVDETIQRKACSTDVLSNDVDINKDINHETITIVSEPKNGSVSIDKTTGKVNYMPNDDFSGKDQYIYVIFDNEGQVSNKATVTIFVEEHNEAPVAKDDSYEIEKSSCVTMDILANDTDADGSINPATVKITSQPKHGTAIVHKSGEVTYTPTQSFTGSDSFKYSVADDKGFFSNKATVNIIVDNKS